MVERVNVKEFVHGVFDNGTMFTSSHWLDRGLGTMLMTLHLSGSSKIARASLDRGPLLLLL